MQVGGPERKFHVVITAAGSAVHWQSRVAYYWYKKIQKQCEVRRWLGQSLGRQTLASACCWYAKAEKQCAVGLESELWLGLQAVDACRRENNDAPPC